MIRIDIPGVPATKGSGRGIPFRRATGKLGVRVVNDAGDKARAWEYAIGLLARQAMRGQAMLEGPVTLAVTFVLTRPKSVKRRTPWAKPDLSKLIRCLEDPLSGVVWHDDAQVIQVSAIKRYAEDGEAPGATVTVVSVPHAA